uniref:CD166 antigen n=1 Tax=Phallusia mammillata TaxID=59560 RepID=A0A6F9D5M6_9ASCI|nr:CD166 antigen [Phallusia mammillata]
MIGRFLIVAAICVIGCQAADITLMLKNVSVYEGETATVPCDYVTSLDTSVPPIIRWHQLDGVDRKRLYIFKKGDENLTGRDASVSRDLQIGPNGELIIPNTTLADNALFNHLSCEVEFGVAGTAEDSLTFIVARKASVDPVTNPDKTNFVMNGDYQIIGNCVSDFAYPEPILEFYKGTKLLQTTSENGNMKVERAPVQGFLSGFTEGKQSTKTPDGLTIKVQDTLLVNLTGADDNAQYSCVVRSGINNEFVQNVSFPRIRVTYPTTSVVVTGDKNPVKAGDTLTLTCAPNGNPDPIISDFGGQQTSEYQVKVSKTDDGQVVSCTAGNGLGQSITGSYTVSVAYLDSPTVTGSETVRKGSPINLQCDAMSNQQVNYMWSKDGADLNVNQATYSLNDADFMDSGMYKCTATTAAGHEEHSSRQVTVNGIEFYGSDVKKSGDMAVLSCTFLSNPGPKIVWMRVGSDVQMPGSNSSSNKDSFTSYLSVGPLDSSFKEAEYTCKASNEALPSQIAQETLNLKGIAILQSPTEGEVPEESSPPIAGIIIGILVALLVVAIILAVLYNKGIICKSDEKGDENAEDIAVDINKDESPDDAESGRKPDNEEEKLMNGNDQ